MFAPRMQSRSLAALLVLLVSTLLLLASKNLKQQFHGQYGTNINRIASRDTSQANAIPLNLTSENARTVPRTFGHQSYTPGFSPAHHQPHVKRALDSKWKCLIAKGKKYYEQGVLAAYAGRPPGQPPQDFGEGEDVLNGFGWSRNEDSEPITSDWNDAFKAMALGAPIEGDISYIHLDQNLEFDNGQGEQAITNARYYAYYSLTGFILVTDSYSPSGQLRRRDVPENEIANQIPLLHRLSDSLWFEWRVHTDQPGTFRYYAVESIINHPTAELMDDIMVARRGSDDVSWAERLTFDLSSDEGKALFGCPNGVAVGWLMIDRLSVLGKRTPRGQSGSFGEVTPEEEDSSDGD
ncbi:MAG: hypothetical protein Q9169_002752 [Polycauliona sp. 2 TL-2023]